MCLLPRSFLFGQLGARAARDDLAERLAKGRETEREVREDGRTAQTRVEVARCLGQDRNGTEYRRVHYERNAVHPLSSVSAEREAWLDG